MTDKSTIKSEHSANFNARGTAVNQNSVTHPRKSNPQGVCDKTHSYPTAPITVNAETMHVSIAEEVE